MKISSLLPTKIKSIIKEFLPPILLPKPKSHFTFFSSYEEAASSCINYGYEQKDLLNIIYHKTIIFRDQILNQPYP